MRSSQTRPRQQGTLANGFQWQVLSTPQRPSDRIEIRLSVNTGSLTESTQQTGLSHFIPRLALTQSGSLQAVQVRSLWQQAIDPKRPLPPAVVSYDYTMFNLSLPNNRNDLLKEALTYLSDATGKLAITPETVNYALSNSDMVATADGYQRRLVALPPERVHAAWPRPGRTAETAGGCRAGEIFLPAVVHPGCHDPHCSGQRGQPCGDRADQQSLWRSEREA